MDAFALWKQEVEAEQDRLESTNDSQMFPEEEQLRRIDTYWLSVVRNIRPDDPDGPSKVGYIQRFANRSNGEYPLTYAAVHNLLPADNAPSITRMKREIAEAADQLRRRSPASSYEDDLFDLIDSKLTNYISDLRKDDPKYTQKREYFKDLIWSGRGMLPNAAGTFERKGHGIPYTMDRIQEEAAAARQALQGGRKTRRHRRRGRGGNPPKVVVSNPGWNLTKPKPATVVISNPIASLPKPPKPNPAAGTGLFTGGRAKKTRKGGLRSLARERNRREDLRDRIAMQVADANAQAGLPRVAPPVRRAPPPGGEPVRTPPASRPPGDEPAQGGRRR